MADLIHPDYGNVTEVANALNERVDSELTGEDYVGWLEPNESNDGNTFDDAVNLLIDNDTRSNAESLARLDALVLYVLELGPQSVGGINLSNLLPK